MWLRERRKQIGILTLEELATLIQLEGIQLSPSSLSHYENERRGIPLEDDRFRSVLAKVLKLSEPELLSLAGYKTVSKHTEDGERAASIVDRLPPSKRTLAIKLLEQVENA